MVTGWPFKGSSPAPGAPWIKICGVQTGEAAQACLEADVDLVGLNFVAWSRRRVSVESAKRLRAQLRSLPVVGIFYDQPLEEIEQIRLELSLDAVQLHGAEPPEVCAALAERTVVFKALAIDAGFDPVRLEAYEPFVAAFLFDAPRAGSGRTFDWSGLSGIPRRRPFFLAGGLHPGNVAEAVVRVAPEGVDTASGVEIDGRKDRALILEFCRNVRRCA